MASNLKIKAKAIVAVRKKKKLEQDKIAAQEALEASLVERLLSGVVMPKGKTGEAGRDGTDAPTMDDILEQITPLLPEATHTTVVQEVDPTDMEVFIKGVLPKILPEDRPAVEQITIDVSDEKLEGFVSQKEFKKVLRKIQNAITANQSGGHPSKDLPKVIEVTEDTTITSAQLDPSKYNVILVKTPDITVTLPPPSDTVLIEVKQGFTGTGTYTICRE